MQYFRVVVVRHEAGVIMRSIFLAAGSVGGAEGEGGGTHDSVFTYTVEQHFEIADALAVTVSQWPGSSQYFRNERYARSFVQCCSTKIVESIGESCGNVRGLAAS